MTLDDLNKLKDAELDRLAAERVMGWKPDPTGRHGLWWDLRGLAASKFRPTRDHNDAAKCCEKAAESKGDDMVGFYLMDVLGIDFDPYDPNVSPVAAMAITASARAKTTAAILAVGGGE